MWLEMRCALWPDETRDTHTRAVGELLDQNDAWGFVAEALDGTAIGFAEVAIRKYANGCESRPVPFLEGIWINGPFRRRRVGAQIIAYVESFLAALGFQELGSDTEIENSPSQAAHLSWGFTETERVVYFRKRLTPIR